MLSNREIFFQHMGLPSLNPLDLEIEKAEGIYLYGKDGEKYIDLVSGVAVSNIGHRHPEVIKRIQNQLDKYMHLMVYGEMIQSPQTQLAYKLKEFLPENLKSTYFVNSGSEAIEGALKLAKRFTGRSEVIAFKNAYHGGTHGALSILGDERLKNAFRPLLPGIKFIEFNNFNHLNQITPKTACVVVETVQAEAGIILPKAGFLQALREKCTETGTLLVIDDIQMGFGRTGSLFSFENFGIVPDILTLAKAMGGGMPIGAFISSQEIMRSLTNKPELGHITTFGGHPVACAAALANLDVITKESIYKQAEKKGLIYKNELIKHPLVTEVRQKGLMLGVDIKGDVFKLVRVFLRNGLITDPFLFRANAFRIAPPLTISEDEITESINLIWQSLSEL
ncbi:MAG TPA: aspartate aminotransferase family protein [Bacteroidales bacterium]|nr:aspartate aminotransferase family protein [Bacteroidales bacterium]